VKRITSLTIMLGAMTLVPPARSQEPTRTTFDSIGARELAEGTAPGFSMVVVHDARVAYARGFGVADVARKTPVTPNTRFAIGSVSKQFAAASILLLAERHRLSLDDKLAAYLPAMPNADRITVRELLNQTSGLHNYPRLGEHPWPLQGTIQPDTLFALLATDSADFPPGTRWEYSNTNYAALAYIVSRASGMSYGDFLERNIFAPLHMTASGSGHAAQSAAATPYQGKAHFTRQHMLSLDLFYGAGGIVSSASDLATWDIALLQGTLLSAPSMHDLWTAGTLHDGTPVKYAMGFVPTTLDGHQEVWHNGLTPGAGGYCYNAIFPDDKLAVIVLSNGLNFTGSPERIVRQVFESYFPEARAAMAAFTPASGEDPDITARAREWLGRLQSGNIDRSQLGAQMNAALTPAVLAQVKRQLSAFGTPNAFQYAGKTPRGTYTEYDYRVTFAKGVQKWLFVLGADRKIAGMRLLPWQTP
jgi:CubicO group peptidase (beta-lactamase class C family)